MSILRSTRFARACVCASGESGEDVMIVALGGAMIGVRKGEFSLASRSASSEGSEGDRPSVEFGMVLLVLGRRRFVDCGVGCRPWGDKLCGRKCFRGGGRLYSMGGGFTVSLLEKKSLDHC